METIKEFVERKQKEVEDEAGPEPVLEGSFGETGEWVNPLWIKWFMTRYTCSHVHAQEEGLRRLKKKSLPQKTPNKLPGIKP